MNTNAIFGLAFLQYNWEHSKKDIIDAYVPIICECIIQMSFNPVNRDDLKAGLKEMYGIDNIPLGALETMLNRCVNKKILKKDKGVYVPNLSELTKNINKSNREDVAAGYDHVVEDIVRFAKERFNISYISQDIEEGLLLFLEEYDIDIMISSDKIDNAFPKINENKKLKYIISKYIIHVKEHKKTNFRRIFEIAKGHSIASLITYANFEAYVGQLNQVEIYLDAPIIFNLMNLNGEANFALSSELINQLKDKGAIIKVFDVNQEEVVSTVTDAIERLTTGNYVLRCSSRILRTAVRESYPPSRLSIKLEQLTKLYEKLGIEVVGAPDFDTKYSIDQIKLTEIIEELYLKRSNRTRLYQKQKESIERDVQTISYIYQIRESASPQSLKQSKAILLSSNQAISYSTRNRSISSYGKNSKIAPCETDLFLSTILWANYPSKNGDLKMKQLMTTCYDNIELDDRIFQRFYKDVKKLHEEQAITDEQFYLINVSNLTCRLLEKRTLNDLDEYTDKTPKEIVEDLINQLQHGENVMASNIRSLSTVIAKIIFWVIWLSLFGLIFFVNKILPKFNINSIIWNLVITIGSGILGGFGLFRWIGIVPSKSSIVEFFSNKIYNGIMKVLRKEKNL